MRFRPDLLWLLLPFTVLTHGAVATIACCQDQQLEFADLPTLPDTEGFAGSFAGVSGNHLLVIGGANFPERKPWEGGTKVWYSSVQMLPLVPQNTPLTSETSDPPSLRLDPAVVKNTRWVTAIPLDSPRGYGVSATFRDEVFCVGGSNASGHFSSVFALRYDGKRITRRSLPDLPMPLANHFGTRHGQELIIAGGQQAADSTAAESAVWSLRLDVSDATWTKLPAFPGPPRILAVASSSDNRFWIIGGAALAEGSDGKTERHYLKDAWTFSRETGWSRLPDLPVPCVAALSPAPDFGHGPLVMGGDDGSQVKKQPQSHSGFLKTITRFSLSENRWVAGGSFPPATVTTAAVAVGNDWLIPTGEIRPGVRTPNVWLMRSRTP